MNPEEVPLYATAELARYLRLPASTIRYWIARGGQKGRDASQLLTFEELISLLFVGELRRGHHIPLKEIIRAERDLRLRTGEEHPFAWERLWTTGRDVLVRVPGDDGAYIAANLVGQAALPSWVEPREVTLPALLEPLRHRVDYLEKRAAAWRPAPHVVARPAVQFGLPCVDGSRLPTRTVERAVRAGDSPEAVANAYGVSLDGVRAAVGWEQSLAA